MKAVRYDYVRNFRGDGWRVFQVGPKGGQKTVAVYRTEEHAQRVSTVLNEERSGEL